MPSRCWCGARLFFACDSTGKSEGMSRPNCHGPASGVAPSCPSFRADCAASSSALSGRPAQGTSQGKPHSYYHTRQTEDLALACMRLMSTLAGQGLPTIKALLCAYKSPGRASTHDTI